MKRLFQGRLIKTVAARDKPAPYVFMRNTGYGAAYRLNKFLIGARLLFAQVGFHLAPHFFDGVQVWAIGGQVPYLGTCGFNDGARPFVFVGGQVVHNEYVAGFQCWRKDMFGINFKKVAVDGA